MVSYSMYIYYYYNYIIYYNKIIKIIMQKIQKKIQNKKSHMCVCVRVHHRSLFVFVTLLDRGMNHGEL
jgi:hypothetical protein